MIRCQYCDNLNEKYRQYCISCGKLVHLNVRDSIPDIISVDQITWILIGGYSIYFILRYFLNFNLNFSIILLISALVGFIMMYRLLSITKSSNVEKIKDFFPYWIEFFFIAGIIILLIEAILEISFGVNQRLSFDTILTTKIIPFSFEFIQGYTFGIIVTLFVYKYNRNRQIK